MELSVEITNSGDAQAADVSYRVEGNWREDGIKKGVITSLAAGETKTVTLTYNVPPDARSLTFGIVVDPDNLIPEGDERNNYKYFAYEPGR